MKGMGRMLGKVLNWIKTQDKKNFLIIILVVLLVISLIPSVSTNNRENKKMKEACIGSWVTTTKPTESAVVRSLKQIMSLYPGGTCDLEGFLQSSITWEIQDGIVNITHHHNEGGKTVVWFKLDTSKNPYTLTALCASTVVYTKNSK